MEFVFQFPQISALTLIFYLERQNCQFFIVPGRIALQLCQGFQKIELTLDFLLKPGSLYTCRTSSRRVMSKVLQGKELLRGSRNP
jgi:hypothetical protein